MQHNIEHHSLSKIIMWSSQTVFVLPLLASFQNNFTSEAPSNPRFPVILLGILNLGFGSESLILWYNAMLGCVFQTYGVVDVFL